MARRQEMLLPQLCCFSSFFTRQAPSDIYTESLPFLDSFLVYTLISTEFAPLSLSSPTMLPTTQVSFY